MGVELVETPVFVIETLEFSVTCPTAGKLWQNKATNFTNKHEYIGTPNTYVKKSILNSLKRFLGCLRYSDKNKKQEMGVEPARPSSPTSVWRAGELVETPSLNQIKLLLSPLQQPIVNG
ncbi:MAG: hypothetical protein Q8K98_10490 [Bacteroidota bacterium]|nr:hypothetical protein [Bacteroidota bacterium]